MATKVVGKLGYKCVAVLVCVLIAGSSVQGVVLCFGTDGHVEIETVFHERCNDSAHSQHAEHKDSSYQVGHVENEHCGPCVDFPLAIGLEKITRTSKQLNHTFSSPERTVISPADSLNLSAHNSASITFDAAGYFDPLCTVVLLI